MSISKETLNKFESMSFDARDRMIRLGWETQTSFKTIEQRFGFSHQQLFQFMRLELTPEAFKLWKQRVRAKASRLYN